MPFGDAIKSAFNLTDEQFKNSKVGVVLLFLNEKRKDFVEEAKKARKDGEESPSFMDMLGGLK